MLRKRAAAGTGGAGAGTGGVGGCRGSRKDRLPRTAATLRRLGRSRNIDTVAAEHHATPRRTHPRRDQVRATICFPGFDGRGRSCGFSPSVSCRVLRRRFVSQSDTGWRAPCGAAPRTV